MQKKTNFNSQKLNDSKLDSPSTIQQFNSSTFDGTAIKVENVSKKYCKSLKRSMLYGVKDIARNTIGLSSHSDKLRKNEFWALDDISFQVKKGETLGIIGPNGSGKTTLLILLIGIFWPDKGNITVKGKVGALIEVGAGFHPLLTGRENIYINAAILGMTKKEVDEKFDAIVDFADIGDFLDVPVKHYSSGMCVRLGFAVAVHCELDILLVDEVLAVGDIEFQAKCFNKIGQLKKERNITAILVSHNMHKISGFSDKGLYLSQSKIKYLGDVGNAIQKYKEDVEKKTILPSTEFELGDVRGSGLVRITKVEFLNEDEKLIHKIKSGDILIIRIHYEGKEKIGEIELDLGVRHSSGERFFQGTNLAYGKEMFISKKQGYIEVHFNDFCMNDHKALFFFALWKKNRSELFDWKREVPLNVIGNTLLNGKVLLNIDWILKERGNIHEFL